MVFVIVLLNQSTYFAYRATASAECPANPWRIQNNALFMRLDSFLERCNDILDLTQTIVQFSKLAKVEVGGTKGKTLTASVAQIHHDFQVRETSSIGLADQQTLQEGDQASCAVSIGADD